MATEKLLLVVAMIGLGLRVCAWPQARVDGNVAGLTDVAVVKERLVRSVLPVEPEEIAHLQQSAAADAAVLRADGSWADVDYRSTSRSKWAAAEHLQRTLRMAKAARLMQNAGRQDGALEAKTLLALQHWTVHDYRNPNWWWNQIGVPELVGEIGLLLGDALPPDERARITAIMRRAEWRGETGTNLTWTVMIQIMRGCLLRDEALVGAMYARMYGEIKRVGIREEGIEADNSFHQHGAQLYSGGYGMVFVDDVGRFISFAWGTRFQISPERMAILSAFMLDGEQWLVRGDVMDYSSIGREIVRPGLVALPKDWTVGPISPAGPAYSLGHVAELLAALPSPRQKEFAAFAARLRGDLDAQAFEGNQGFWCSDFMVHRRKGFSTSVKMLSKRMFNGELTNEEGKRSQHLSDGVNYLYLAGDEYKDIFPVWDWTKLPGITAIQGTLETGKPDSIHVRGTTAFAGSVSDGTYGMAAMNLARGGLKAEKAWFFFDDGYVALGAGITLTGDAQHSVATDINQTLLAGDVLTSAQRSALTSGVHPFDGGLAWVYHNHVGYIPGPGLRMVVSNDVQTGRWSDIGSWSNELIRKPVFNLWIDHGTEPREASYQYTVLPGVAAEELAAWAAAPHFAVLANTPELQAVYDPGLKLVEIAFRKAQAIQTPEAKIAVDHACLLMVQTEGAGWRVTAANPENEGLTLHVTVNGKQGTMELPAGNRAGASVRVSIR